MGGSGPQVPQHYCLFTMEFLHPLEGYTYGDEPWPSEISGFRLTYESGEERNLQVVEKQITEG